MVIYRLRGMCVSEIMREKSNLIEFIQDSRNIICVYDFQMFQLFSLPPIDITHKLTPHL